MTDYFYRFDDRPAMLAALDALGMVYTPEEGEPQVSQGGHQYAAWEVGEIPGYTGWHLNLRVVDESFDVSSLEPFRVIPSAPRCVWA